MDNKVRKIRHIFFHKKVWPFWEDLCVRLNVAEGERVSEVTFKALMEAELTEHWDVAEQPPKK